MKKGNLKRRYLIQQVSMIPVWVSPLVQSFILPTHAQTSPPCVSELPFGLIVTVLDAATGNNIACLSSGTISEGSYTSNLRHYHPFSPPQTGCDSPILGGAMNRPGTYSLRIMASAYVPHVANNIVVADAPCYTQTVRIEVRLKPA